jgi:hypothetical protein
MRKAQSENCGKTTARHMMRGYPHSHFETKR